MNILQQSALAWKELTEYNYLLTYLCCSAFKQGDRNYETNQRSYTLLKKERLHISSNTSTVFFNKIKPITNEEKPNSDV